MISLKPDISVSAIALEKLKAENLAHLQMILYPSF